MPIRKRRGQDGQQQERRRQQRAEDAPDIARGGCEHAHSHDDVVRCHSAMFEAEVAENWNRMVLVIVAIAVVLHANTLRGDFVYDDARGVKSNPDVTGERPLSELFINDFWGKPIARYQSHKSYRPLTVLTFRLDYFLANGLEPMQFHITNVLLHALVCALYLRVCCIVFGSVRPAMAASILFTVHSIHTEAVANIVGRAEVLASVFFLSSLLIYTYAAHPNAPARTKWVPLMVSLGFAFASMLSKEQGITVLGVLAVYDVGIACGAPPLDTMLALCGWNSGQLDINVVSELRLRVFAIAIMGVSLLSFRVWMMGEGNPIFNEYELPAWAHPDLVTRVLTFNYYAVINAGLLMLPISQSSDWSYRSIPLVHVPTDIRFLLILLLYLVLAFALVLVMKWKPDKAGGDSRGRFAPVLGVVWLCVAYVPSSNLFFKVGFVIAERILFIPSMGYCIVIGYIYTKSHRKLPKLSTAIFAALCTFLSVRTVIRNSHWQSDFTLHEAGATEQPYNIKLVTNYGMLLHDRSKDADSYPDEIVRQSYARRAEAVFDKALNEVVGDDHFPNLYFVYGNLMVEKGDTERAIELYKSGLAKKDKTGTTLSLLNNLASQLYKKKRYAEAEESWNACIAIDASHISAMNGLATLYATVGRSQEAEGMFKKITNSMPGYVEGWFNYGTFLAGVKRWTDAEMAFKKALSLSPGHTGAITNLKYVEWHRQKEVKGA